MTSSLRAWWFLGILALLLGGCAKPDLGEPSGLVLQERQGRFSVQVQKGAQPVDGLQGSFVWRRLPSGWQLDLNSPLGATLARLTSTAAGATLQRPDAPTRRAASGQELLASVIGVSIPPEVLLDWLEARVGDDGQITNLVRDAQGRPTSFSSGPWRVVLDRYGPSGPGRITVQSSQPGRDVRLRLVID